MLRMCVGIDSEYLCRATLMRMCVGIEVNEYLLCVDNIYDVKMCVGIEVNEYLLSRSLRHVENVCWD